MVRERGQKVVATNRKARHDYHILDVFEAGIVLTGTEVKTLREGRASLVDGYASIDGGEAWLENEWGERGKKEARPSKSKKKQRAIKNRCLFP
mgnify:CR=1 FL=1